MKPIMLKIAALLAFVIGAMAILAGGPVLLGRDPGYYVISWLPIYNLLVGFVSAFLTAILIWRGSRWAKPASLGTFGLHLVVMLTLLTVYRGVVAFESLTAMTVRIIVWLVIIAILWAEARREGKKQLPSS